MLFFLVHHYLAVLFTVFGCSLALASSNFRQSSNMKYFVRAVLWCLSLGNPMFLFFC